MRVRFFYRHRLFQGANVRLELCDFLLVASLRLALLTQLLRAFHGLASPRITTAEDLRVLQHRATETWRSLTESLVYQI